MAIVFRLKYSCIMGLRLLSIFFCSLVLIGNVHAGDKTVVLNSLDWPPYTSESLLHNGATAEVVRAAFEASGYTLTIHFYPWARTLSEAVNNPEVAGYFPEYYSQARARQFLYSDSIGFGPLGFVQRKKQSIHWEDLLDLTHLRIGVVRGYVNSRDFDRLVKLRVLKVDESVNDMSNLRKLLARRIDLAVADMNVYRYLAGADPQLREGQQELEPNPKLLTTHTLHVCFRKDKQGKRLLKAFNEGLSQIDPLRIQQEYFDSLLIKE